MFVSANKMKRGILSLLCVGLLSIVFLPSPAFSAAISQGTASVSNLLFSGATVDFFDRTDPNNPVDTRGSFSGAQVWLGDPTLPEFSSGSIDGAPWGATFASVSLPPAPDPAQVTGTANTFDTYATGPALLALSDITLTSPSSAGVGVEDQITQAVFSGQFTGSGFLQITADYNFLQDLFNDFTGLTATNNVSVGLVISDFNTTDPITGQSLILVSDVRSLTNSIGTGSLTASEQSGIGGVTPLSISWNLDPTFVYDFEVFASTTAAVPEPGVILLLGSGLIGLGVLRNRRVC